VPEAITAIGKEYFWAHNYTFRHGHCLTCIAVPIGIENETTVTLCAYLGKPIRAFFQTIGTANSHQERCIYTDYDLHIN
jgi:hypothetical protein